LIVVVRVVSSSSSEEEEGEELRRASRKARKENWECFAYYAEKQHALRVGRGVNGGASLVPCKEKHSILSPFALY
jgi:hypothetical protein